MVYRTAARYAANGGDLFLSCQPGIDFLKRVLMIADYYRRSVDVKQHIFMAEIQIAVAVLLQGQIDCRIGYVAVVDLKHVDFLGT